jgi:hypothetical protein
VLAIPSALARAVKLDRAMEVASDSVTSEEVAPYSEMAPQDLEQDSTTPQYLELHGKKKKHAEPCKITEPLKNSARLRGIEPWTSCLGPQHAYNFSYESLLHMENLQPYLIRANKED